MEGRKHGQGRQTDGRTDPISSDPSGHVHGSKRNHKRSLNWQFFNTARSICKERFK